MINNKSVIDDAFEKEIGITKDAAFKFLVKEGISIKDIEKITDKTKNMLTNEIEKRNVPYEYRFLLANVILCTMFNTAATFHKEFMKISGNSQELDEKWFNNIKLVKEK